MKSGCCFAIPAGNELGKTQVGEAIVGAVGVDQERLLQPFDAGFSVTGQCQQFAVLGDNPRIVGVEFKGPFGVKLRPIIIFLQSADA